MLFAAAAVGWLVAGADARVFVEHVETSTLAASFVELLKEELPADRLASSRDDARLIVEVAGRGGAIFVVAREDSGAIAVERAIDAGRARSEVRAALRVAVLLVREVVLDWRERAAVASTGGANATAAVNTTTAAAVIPPEAEPVEPAADPFVRAEPAEPIDAPPVEDGARFFPWRIELTPMIGAFAWWRPALPPLLAFGAAIHAAPSETWRAGVTAYAAGFGCCTRRTNDGTADLRELMFLAEAEWMPIAFDTARAWQGGVAAGAGAGFMYGTARAEGFAAPATEIEVPLAAHLQLESALAARYALTDRVALRLLFGPRWTIPRRTVAVSGPLGGDAPIDRGYVSLFASFGAAINFW